MASPEDKSEKIDLFSMWESDLRMTFRNYSHEKFDFAVEKRGAELNDLVINSDVMKSVIKKNERESIKRGNYTGLKLPEYMMKGFYERVDEQETKEKLCEEGEKEADAKQKATDIVNEIGHKFNLMTIRLMFFLITKIAKRLFRNLYVNKSGIEQLREIIKLGPLIFVPSHNSYFDFLLLSYSCFALDLPLPAIASGQDFLHVAIVNRLLRGSGAFYMRRTFSNDECYKLLFKEYVTQLVGSGSMPVEFFPEGTRSRNGKASQPKSGLLSMINEVYLTGHTPDIYYCPISIAFERIPEENLYTYELLGLPKPKESLSALFNSKSVLAQDYGSVHLHFGRPMSLAEMTDFRIDRSLYTAHTRHVPELATKLAAQEKLVNDEIGKLLVHEQQRNMALSLRSIVAALMLHQRDDISLENFVTECCTVADLLMASCCNFSLDGDVNSTSVERAIHLLYPNVELDGSLRVRKTPAQIIDRELRFSSLGKCFDTDSGLGAAITDIYLSQQRNKLLLTCSVAAYIVTCIHSRKLETFTIDDIFEDVKFLFDLMRLELVYHPQTDIHEEVQRSLDTLQRVSYLERKPDMDVTVFVVMSSPGAERLSSFLSTLFLPFFQAYWFVCQLLLAAPPTTATSHSKVAQQIQLQAASAVNQGLLETHEVLSSQTLKNSLTFLVKSGALQTTRDPSLQLLITDTNPSEIVKILNKICDIVKLPTERLSVNGTNVSHAGKL